jgi:hypothetical protein
MATPTNPANAAKPVLERKRVPMSVPTRRLEVPEIPGFHLHWFLEGRIPRALAAGYELVKFDEVPINQRGVGTDTMISGNSDMGSNVSVIAGMGENGKPENLVLMKLREEWWQEDRKIIDERNASIFTTIFKGERILGEEHDERADQGTRYIDADRTRGPVSLFQRPPRKT